jgi:hypothetical protein
MPSNVATNLLGLVVLGVVIGRQVTPRRPTPFRFYLLPLLALFWAYHSLPHPVPAAQVEAAWLSIGVSVPFGVMQAYFTRLVERDGQWLLQGDWRYVVSWLVLSAVHVAMAVALHETEAVTWVIALDVAVVWGLRAAVLHLRYPRLPRILRQGT